MGLRCSKCGTDLEEKLYEGDFLELWRVENIIGLGVRAIRERFLKTGMLPYYVFGFNDIRIKRTDLNAFLKTRRAIGGVFPDGTPVSLVLKQEEIRRQLAKLREDVAALERMEELYYTKKEG